MSYGSDGLLLLLRAAKKLDEEGASQRQNYSTQWVPGPSNRSPYGYKLTPSQTYSPPHSKRTIAAPRYSQPTSASEVGRDIAPRSCSHNELEKSRRAHLRTCMENLKAHLNFDNDVPRITMLTVLKKATSTIQNLRQTNMYLETYEENEKKRSAQLLKRRQALKKRLEEKRSRALQNWRDRNRNSSECSVNTTSSDDSEMDLHFRSAIRSKQHLEIPSFALHSPPNGMVIVSEKMDTESYVLNNFKHTSRPPSGLDAFDANSLDSGFDSNGVTSPDDRSSGSPICFGSQESKYEKMG